MPRPDFGDARLGAHAPLLTAGSAVLNAALVAWLSEAAALAGIKIGKKTDGHLAGTGNSAGRISRVTNDAGKHLQAATTTRTARVLDESVEFAEDEY